MTQCQHLDVNAGQHLARVGPVRWVQSLDAALNCSTKLHIAAIGSSATHSVERSASCTGLQLSNREAGMTYPTLFGKALHVLSKQHNNCVTVTNAAIGGSVIEYWQHCWPLHMPATATMVLLEVREGSMGALERMLRALLVARKLPVLVETGFWRNVRLATMCRQRELNKKKGIINSAHLAQHYRLARISLPARACQRVAHNDPAFTTGNGTLYGPGTNPFHLHEGGHRQLAQLLLQTYASQSDSHAGVLHV